MHKQLQQPPQPTDQQQPLVPLPQGPLGARAQLVQDIQERSLLGGGAVSENTGGLLGAQAPESAVLQGQGETPQEGAAVGQGTESVTTSELGRQTEELGDFFATADDDANFLEAAIADL